MGADTRVAAETRKHKNTSNPNERKLFDVLCICMFPLVQ